MKRFKIFLSLLLVPGLVTLPVFAELPSSEHQQLEKFVDIYKQLHTLGNVLDASKLSVADYAFLQQKVGAALTHELPKLRLWNDSLQFNDHGDVFTLHVLSLKNRKYSLNGTVIDLSKPSSPATTWELIENALPKSRANAWDLAIPRAYACEAMCLIAIGALVFTAVSTIVSLATAYMSVRASNQNNCRENWIAVDDCRRQLGIINDYTRVGAARFQKLEDRQPVAKASDSQQKQEAAKAEATNWKDMVEQMKKGQCPLVPLNATLDRDTAQMISSVLRTGATKTTLWNDCDVRARNQAAECIGKLAKVGKDVCFTMTPAAYEGITDKKMSDPPSLSTATKGIVPPVNPQDAPPPPVKAVEEK